MADYRQKGNSGVSKVKATYKGDYAFLQLRYSRLIRRQKVVFLPSTGGTTSPLCNRSFDDADCRMPICVDFYTRMCYIIFCTPKGAVAG